MTKRKKMIFFVGLPTVVAIIATVIILLMVNINSTSSKDESISFFANDEINGLVKVETKVPTKKGNINSITINDQVYYDAEIEVEGDFEIWSVYFYKQQGLYDYTLKSVKNENFENILEEEIKASVFVDSMNFEAKYTIKDRYLKTDEDKTFEVEISNLLKSDEVKYAEEYAEDAPFVFIKEVEYDQEENEYLKKVKFTFEIKETAFYGDYGLDTTIPFTFKRDGVDIKVYTVTLAEEKHLANSDILQLPVKANMYNFEEELFNFISSENGSNPFIQIDSEYKEYKVESFKIKLNGVEYHFLGNNFVDGKFNLSNFLNSNFSNKISLEKISFETPLGVKTIEPSFHMNVDDYVDSTVSGDSFYSGKYIDFPNENLEIKFTSELDLREVIYNSDYRDDHIIISIENGKMHKKGNEYSFSQTNYNFLVYFKVVEIKYFSNDLIRTYVFQDEPKFFDSDSKKLGTVVRNSEPKEYYRSEDNFSTEVTFQNFDYIEQSDISRINAESRFTGEPLDIKVSVYYYNSETKKLTLQFAYKNNEYQNDSDYAKKDYILEFNVEILFVNGETKKVNPQFKVTRDIELYRNFGVPDFEVNEGKFIENGIELGRIQNYYFSLINPDFDVETITKVNTLESKTDTIGETLNLYYPNRGDGGRGFFKITKVTDNPNYDYVVKIVGLYKTGDTDIQKDRMFGMATNFSVGNKTFLNYTNPQNSL